MKDSTEEVSESIQKVAKALQKKGVPIRTSVYAATMGLLRSIKKK